MPHSSCEKHPFFLLEIVDFAFHAKEKTLFHSQSHIVDGGFFLVAHSPAHFLISNLLQGALLDLHLENLTMVLSLLGHSFKLWALHIEFGCCTPHSYQFRSHWNGRHTALHIAHFLAVGCHHHQCAVFVFRHHIQHKAIAGFVHTTLVVAIHLGHKNRVGHIEHIIIHRVDYSTHIILAYRVSIRLVVVVYRFGASFFSVHIVVVHHHATRRFGSCTTRQLVDRCSHRAYFHYLLVYFVKQQAVARLLHGIEGEWTIHYVLSTINTSNKCHCKQSSLVVPRNKHIHQRQECQRCPYALRSNHLNKHFHDKSLHFFHSIQLI